MLDTQRYDPRQPDHFFLFCIIVDKPQKLPGACLAYLKSMIYSWNGLTGREIILDLLVYTPIDTWDGGVSRTV